VRAILVAALVAVAFMLGLAVEHAAHEGDLTHDAAVHR
jgi:hypothetical protein